MRIVSASLPELSKSLRTLASPATLPIRSVTSCPVWTSLAEWLFPGDAMAIIVNVGPKPRTHELAGRLSRSADNVTQVRVNFRRESARRVQDNINREIL